MKTKKLLLIVDDNKEESFLLQEAIKDTKINFDMKFLEDGQQVIDYFYDKDHVSVKPNLPDLIILDLNLPKKHGFEVLEQLKSDKSIYKSIPVIIFSSSEAPSDIRRCYELHCNAYISKPINFDEMVSIVQNISSFWFENATLHNDIV